MACHSNQIDGVRIRVGDDLARWIAVNDGPRRLHALLAYLVRHRLQPRPTLAAQLFLGLVDGFCCKVHASSGIEINRVEGWVGWRDDLQEVDFSAEAAGNLHCMGENLLRER